ncbi:MAG: transglutaminase domain-containing protein [Pseudomonadota bacterium]
MDTRQRIARSARNARQLDRLTESLPVEVWRSPSHEASRRRALVLLVLAAVVLLPSSQSSSEEREPIIHEYLPPPDPGQSGEENDRATGGASRRIVGQAPTAGRNPAAFLQDGAFLPQPSATGTQPTTAAAPGPALDLARRSNERPDSLTDFSGELGYQAVFNPSVIPFKRMSVFDAVMPDYTLAVYDDSQIDLLVGGDDDPGRRLFWGSLPIILGDERCTPIPSVAAEMRIRSYQAEPPISLVFSKDGADNYCVRSSSPHRYGSYRLVFLADAPESYFAASLPRPHQAIGEGTGIRPLPPRILEVARAVQRLVGVDSGQPLREVLSRLVLYFRSFEPGQLRHRTGDIYNDLAIAKRGVCRHRAFAFMVTANALGIPARYVANEAHAFVEVWLPEQRWVRIDLGGAGNPTQPNLLSPAHPSAPHSLPRWQSSPPSTAASSSAPSSPFSPSSPSSPSSSPSSPSSPSSRPSSPLPAQSIPPSPTTSTPASSVTPPSTRPSPLFSAGPETPHPASASTTATSGPRETPPLSGPASSLEVTFTVVALPETLYRGQRLTVTGRAVTDRLPAANIPVEIHLVHLGNKPAKPHLVAHCQTDPLGAFSTTIALPADMPLGHYEIRTTTPDHSSGLPGSDLP